MLGWESSLAPGTLLLAYGLQSLALQGAGLTAGPSLCCIAPVGVFLLPSPPKHFQTLQRHQCRAYVENLAAGPQGAFSLVPDASHAPPSLAQGPQHQIFSPAKRRASENKQDM